MVDIIIPTFKKANELLPLIYSIKKTAILLHNLIITSDPGSAAKNRNIGLDLSKAKIIIMIDDDMDNFYPGWDMDLLKPMIDDPSIILMSGRLRTIDGYLAAHMGVDSGKHDQLMPAIFPADNDRVCTALLAIRSNRVRFDENFVGSGFEDTDYCLQIKKEYPDAKIMVNNRCILTHLNERKNQTGDIWEKNKRYFFSKWPDDVKNHSE